MEKIIRSPRNKFTSSIGTLLFLKKFMFLSLKNYNKYKTVFEIEIEMDLGRTDFYILQVHLFYNRFLGVKLYDIIINVNSMEKKQNKISFVTLG